MYVCVEPLSAKAVSPLERGEPSPLSHCAPLSRGAVTSVTEGLFIVSFSSFELLLPPHPLLPHDGLLSILVNLAYKVISHVVHVGIVVTHVVNSASENHHSKLNQSFAAFSNVISGVSIVYFHVLFSLFVHPSSSYVMVYSTGVQ